MALILPKSKDVTLALRMLFLKTEKKLVAELKRQQAKDLVDYGTYASLMRVQKILQNMEDESFVYVPEMVNKVFRDTNSRYAYEAAEALTVPQTAIAEQLTYNLLGKIEEAAETALKTSETILQIGRLHPDVFRNPAIAASLESEALGGSWSTAVKSALRTYQNEGITSFVDKSGRNWSLTDYCTMATRTVTNQASVAAALTSDDWDLWQIVGGRATCSVCSAYQGRVYSKSGTNPDYPPLSMAFGKVDAAGGNDLANTYLNIHPNCLCSLVRYTTAGKTDKQIERDKEFSSFEKRPANVDYRSKKQLAAYREKERTRAEFLQTRRQWNDYRDRLGKEIPSLETFEKHKKAEDDKYKAWEKAYRKKGAELRKENPELFVKKPKPAPVPQKTTEEWRQEYKQAQAEATRKEAQASLARLNVSSAEKQNVEMQKRIAEYPDSRYAQRYRQQITQNERTIASERAKAEGLETELAEIRQTQYRAEDAIVADYLKGTKTITDPSMSEALKNTNPHFNRSFHGSYRPSKPEPYNSNCQRCVIVYEARRRGFNVTAKPSFADDKLPIDRYWQAVGQGGLKPEEGISAARNSIVKKNIEERMATFGEGSRAVVRCTWKGSYNGHFFIVEQRGGEAVFIDPQTGNEDCSSFFDSMKPGKTKLFRVDNMKFSPLIEEMFERVVE